MRNRRRSILTILSVAASLCLLGVLSAIYYSFYFTEATGQSALRLIVRNKVSLANPFPSSYRDRIRHLPGVAEVTIFQWFGGTYKDASDMSNFFGRFAVEPDKLFTVYPDFHIPPDQLLAFQKERTACIIGNKLAARKGFKIGDRIQIVGDIFPVTLDLTVRGIYQAERDNENLFFHFGYLNDGLSGAMADQIFLLVVLAESAEAVPRLTAAVDDLFRNATVQTKTETERAFELSFLAFLGNVKAFFMLISAAVTFTVLLITANTMAMSVRERTREVGILKTIGFTPGEIRGMLVGESVTISILGGAAGLVLAHLLCETLRAAPSTFADLSRIRLNPTLLAFCMGVAIVIGIASCLVPAWSASRKPIVEALRVSD